MSSYNVINGLKVRFLTADPPSPENGEVWYNSSSIRAQGIAGTGVWSSGGSAPAGLSGSSMAGNNTDAMQWGGDNGGGTPTWPRTSHHYNGTSWTGDGTIPTSVNNTGQAGVGHTTAIMWGGYNPPGGAASVTNKFNGSSWTASGNLNNARQYAYSTGAGPQTAAVAIGGGPNQAVHEHFNGSSWTTKTSFPSGANSVYAIGTQAATLGVSGANGTTASWNGSSWTGIPSSLNNNRQYGAAGGSNTSSAYVFGGGSSTTVELYNGTSWATQPSMARARESGGGSGITSNALIAGSTYGNSSVEEFTIPFGTATISSS